MQLVVHPVNASWANYNNYNLSTGLECFCMSITKKRHKETNMSLIFFVIFILLLLIHKHLCVKGLKSHLL